MRYSTIKYNDVANAPGICVSVYLQGCDQHCPHCFNQSTWDFDGGQDLTAQDIDNIIKGLEENGIHRNLCILGGEPLHDRNIFTTLLLVNTVKDKYPDKLIYIWTGYLYEDLLQSTNPKMEVILNKIDYLIDGPYIHELRDLTLKMRGSSNQRIINMKEGGRIEN